MDLIKHIKKKFIRLDYLWEKVFFSQSLLRISNFYWQIKFFIVPNRFRIIAWIYTDWVGIYRNVSLLKIFTCYIEYHAKNEIVLNFYFFIIIPHFNAMGNPVDNYILRVIIRFSSVVSCVRSLWPWTVSACALPVHHHSWVCSNSCPSIRWCRPAFLTLCLRLDVIIHLLIA